MEILQKFHCDELYGGHNGQKRLYAKLRSEFYWARMTIDTAKFVNECHTWKVSKPGFETKKELKLTDTPQKPFDLVQIDTIGPIRIKSSNGHQYAITIVCDLTKYFIAIPVSDKSAKTIAKAIFENFCACFWSHEGHATTKC